MPSSLLNSGRPDAAELLMPLLFFYGDQGALPEIQFINGEEMPDPHRHLLVHASDMTPRLRDFHQSDISLQVVEVQRTADCVMRMVVLRRASDGKPVEFGAILIQLDGFPRDVADLIRMGSAPLGGILESHSVPHRSEPRGYFEVVTDERIGALLETPAGTVLHGRCNALLHPDGIVFADIVEILPL